ncbi:sensor histidine kinase [Noviherbaspirillum sp. ST9]|uniref:sensor histidine kinase n=1 Tax=Noviherbaspirillum sp. ST9 TaxID=3401606 RepID=UPI003B5881D5
MALEKSIVRRYLILSLLASVVPVVWIGLLYDRFAESAFQEVIDEKLSAHLTATASRISGFVEARRYQAETLANFPGMAGFAGSDEGVPSDQVGALLQVESDLPDLFGILFFGEDDSLKKVVPGQAASGPPYWSETTLEIGELPQTRAGDVELVGPAPPVDGNSGWLLVRYPLRDVQQDGARQVALHVRLASLTELMGADPAAGAAEPVLKTPAGYFNRVGHLVSPRGKLIAGPEIYPGWQPMLQVEPSQLLEPFDRARRALFIAALVGAVLIVILFTRMSTRLRQRVGQLLAGANAISSGRLEYRIADHGEDEIATVSRAFDAMAQRLEQHLARIVRMEKLAVLGEFATNIAHEVRNPLAAVKTTVQALSRREADERRLQLLTDVESEIDRLARVVSQLLDFGRPRPPVPEEVGVRDILRRVMLLLEPEADNRKVSLSAQGDSDIVIIADADHVVQILLNLGMNALQASEAGGAVVLRATRETSMAVLEVSDQGHGIPDDVLPRVTDPFFTTKSKGMGLGLSISRQLAEINGGRLDIRSTPGSGTSVRVFFPLAWEKR